MKNYFSSLIQTHSWSTVKLDRNGLQFFYHYTLDKQWEWLNIVKPPQVRRLPDILTPAQISKLINGTKKQRYQVFFLTFYSMGLRLSEGLNLSVHDIDSQTMQVHIREAKGGKDRLVQLPKRTLLALRCHWQTHHHARLIFPGLGNGMNSGRWLVVSGSYNKTHNQAILLHLFNWEMPELVATIAAKAIRICPCCQHEMKCIGITRTTQPKGEHNKDNGVNIRTWRGSIYGEHSLVN